MQHWYVYHSNKAMGRSYSSLGESAVYSKSERPKLCFGDVIWVIEGPDEFTLVDCYRYQDTDYAPLAAPFSEFKLKFKGDSSLLPRAVSLDKDWPWFEAFRKTHLSKQKFFGLLDEDLLAHLSGIAGVSF